MIDWLQVIALAVVQGLTEFLPISSTAHLILLPKLFNWVDEGLSFDIALHFGTLIAVLLYFKEDIKQMLQDTLLHVKTKKSSPGSLLFLQLVIATIPVGIAGLLLHDYVETIMRSAVVIGFSTIFFGIFLYLSDRYSIKAKENISTHTAILMGIAQAIALIPGTSRSGITLTAGLALGLNRQLAARFSFLMAIPVISLAMLLEMKKMLASPAAQPWLAIGVGAVISAVCAYACIHYFLKILNKLGVVPFVIYRFFLGATLLYLFY